MFVYEILSSFTILRHIQSFIMLFGKFPEPSVIQIVNCSCRSVFVSLLILLSYWVIILSILLLSLDVIFFIYFQFLFYLFCFTWSGLIIHSTVYVIASLLYSFSIIKLFIHLTLKCVFCLCLFHLFINSFHYLNVVWLVFLIVLTILLRKVRFCGYVVFITTRITTH